MAEIERKTKCYPTDLTDEEWVRIEPFLPKPAKTGRRRGVDLREVLNAIRYLARTGCGWRMLPKDFPPWQTVYWWFRRFVRLLLFRTIHDIALMIDRERAGREASPTGGVLDSQSVKAPAAKERGFDGGKKIVGRKRHIAVDTDGRLLMVNLTPADISDSAGAQMILDAIRKRWPWLKHLFADGAYDRVATMLFEIGQTYNRRRDIHDRFGGQRHSGGEYGLVIGYLEGSASLGCAEGARRLGGTKVRSGSRGSPRASPAGRWS